MRRILKIKPAAGLVSVRKAALTAAVGVRRSYPAWIDSEDRTVPATAVAVTPRIRTSLVLRQVTTRKPASAKGSNHAYGAR